MTKPLYNDFGYTWWKNGYTGSDRTLYTRTRLFGAALRCDRGTIEHFGAIASQTDEDCSEIDCLPPLEVLPVIHKDGVQHSLAGIEPTETYSSPFGQSAEAGVFNRILESGRIVQRNDLMLYRFDGTDIGGRMELALFPEHCALSFELFSPWDCTVRLTLSLRRPGASACEGMLITRSGGKTQYLRACGLEPCGDSFTVSSVLTLKAGAFNGITVILLPSLDGRSLPETGMVQVSAETLSPEKGISRPVSKTADGIINISQDNMFSCFGQDFNDGNIYTCDRMLLTLKNPYPYPVRLPVRFEKNPPLSITGLCPVLLDENGEPSGIPVQLTKNWHYFPVQKSEVSGNASAISPKRHFEGQWFHGYAVIDLPASSVTRLIYACSFATWGRLFAASHAQLCLAGWGGGQQWETSAVGSFGESFCYDIARSWTWCCMGDICPGFIYSRLEGRKYDWTGNIGGGDFLFYISGGKRIGFAAMRTDFRSHGPCMTEVCYRGRTQDGAAEVRIEVFMGRTNDIVHALHRFEYTFVRDVEYERMSFYQMGSDSYNYDYWDHACIGSENGTVKKYTIKGEGENKVDLPGDGEWGDYVDYGISQPGMYFGLYGCERGHAYGDKLMLIHQYDSVINGVSRPPVMAVRTSNVMNRWRSVFPELVPPERSGRIEKGSHISGCVDYICLPASADEYYGGSSFIKAIPPEIFDTPEIFARLSAAGRIELTAQTGEVKRLYPPLIQSCGDTAEFTLRGGFAYTPVSICGLSEHCGFECLRTENGVTVPVAAEQEVYGNDFWQCRFDAQSNTYILTYNLPQGHYIIRKRQH